MVMLIISFPLTHNTHMARKADFISAYGFFGGITLIIELAMDSYPI
jgi:hypothetical protein